MRRIAAALLVIVMAILRAGRGSPAGRGLERDRGGDAPSRPVPARAACSLRHAPGPARSDASGTVARSASAWSCIHGGTGALPLLGTIVAVQGGPGYATRQYRDSYLDLFRPLLGRYQLLLVDNRGTGDSGAIDCPKLQSYRGNYVRNAGACGRQLGATAADYGTADAADDLADVVTALGIDRIDLYGDSYGTFFGQVFAVRHPDLLRSLVLDSAYPVVGPDPWYRDTNRALRAAFGRACRRDPGCAAVPGGPMQRMRRLAAALQRHPIVGTAFDADGVLRHVTVDVGALITFATAAASSFDLYRELDPAIRAYLGPDHDTRPLLRLAAENLYFSGAGDPHAFSEGLYLATNCNDTTLPFDRNATVPVRRRQYAAAIRRLTPQRSAGVRTVHDQGVALGAAVGGAALRLLHPVAPAGTGEPSAAAASGVSVGPRAGPVGRPGSAHLTGGRPEVARRSSRTPRSSTSATWTTSRRSTTTGGARRRSSSGSCGRSPPATRLAHGGTTRSGSSTGSR